MDRPYQPEEQARIAEGLVSRNAKEREAVRHTLRQMEPGNAVRLLLDMVEYEKKRRRKNRLYIGLLCIVTIFVSSFLITDTALSWVLFYMMCFVSFISILASPQESAAIRELAALGDRSTVGPLIDALGSMSGEGHSVIIEALTRILPTLQASDAGLLNDRQRQRLSLELLHPGEHYTAEFCIAILKALEQIGDEGALPVVERIARGESPNFLPGSRIYEAAQECLLFMQERVRNAREASRLLRPANPPEDASAVLLRPAGPGAETDPRLLLRPVGMDGGKPAGEQDAGQAGVAR